MNDSLEQPSPLQDVPSYATSGTVTAEAFARIVCDWASGKGISRTNAIVALSGTPHWMEARRRHRGGATEKVVRYLLSASLAGSGLQPNKTE